MTENEIGQVVVDAAPTSWAREVWKLKDRSLFPLNFGEALMKYGITRAVNNLEE